MNDIEASSSIKRFSIAYNAITCIYMSALLFALVCLDNIYQIGKYKTYLIPLYISVSEILKLNIIKYFNCASEQTKTRKHAEKFKLKDGLRYIVISMIMMSIYYFVSILFGAPFLSDQEGTIMFSVLLTTLTIIPTCLCLGFDATVELFSNLTNEKRYKVNDLLLRNTQITLAGAWLGAMVIPLDWDRPWQVWPIPCSLGAIIGYTFVNAANLIILTT